MNKALHGREDDICPCIRCNTCISRSNFFMKPPRCAANPKYNRGMDYNYMPPIKKKKRLPLWAAALPVWKQPELPLNAVTT